MESLNIKTYLVYAVYIIRTHPRILMLIVGLGLVNEIAFLLPESGLANVTNSLTIIFSIFISPLIYGIYTEAIEQRQTPVAEVFRKYVPGYLLLLLCLYIPVVFVTMLLISSIGQAANPTPVMLVLILLFSLLFIYVIPSFFILRSIQGAIIAGLRFIRTRFADSAPVLLLALVSELLLLLTNYQLGGLRDAVPVIYAFIDFSAYIIASFLDFTLFIILIYILKNNGVTPQENPDQR